MRKVALTRNNPEGIARVILYVLPYCAYVFPCSSEEDGSAVGDYWFEDLAGAEAFCERRYGIRPEDWTEVPDPPPGCQHDWIAPVRVKGRAEGRPEWGRFERFEGGAWTEIAPTATRKPRPAR